MYDPAKDDLIFKNYSASNFRTNKKVNKEKLQELLGLVVDKKKYMIGLISRLTDQKGLDLVNYCIERLVDDNTQTGRNRYWRSPVREYVPSLCMEIPGPNIRKHLLFRGSGSQVIRSGRAFFDAVAL